MGGRPQGGGSEQDGLEYPLRAVFPGESRRRVRGGMIDARGAAPAGKLLSVRGLSRKKEQSKAPRILTQGLTAIRKGGKIVTGQATVGVGS